MKKRSVLVPLLVFLMLFAVVAPAMAESPKKIPVKTVVISTRVIIGSIVTNPGEIRHLDDMIWEGVIDLYIPETSSTPLRGTSRDVLDGMRVVDVPGGVEHSDVNFGVVHFRRVLTFGDGAFEGILTLKTYGPGFTVFESHCVLQGSGDFKGQTLSLSSVVPPGPPTGHGELLIP